VLAVLEEAGYTPSRLATGLSTGRTGLLGLMIGENRDPTAVTVMQGALSAAVPAHYGVVVYVTTSEREHEALYSDMVARGGIDGALLLFPTRDDEPFVRRIADRGLPLVLIEPQVAMPGIPTVEPDVFDDAYRSTRYLLELGHRRIAVCGDASGWRTEQQYLDGYRRALTEAGLPVDPALALAAGWTYEIGHAAATDWLMLPSPPTGMCFCCDLAALGALAATRERGVRVPENVSIIGYDDTPIAQWVKPALTVPRERRFGLVQRACEILLGLIRGDAPPAEPLRVTTTLSVRDSTAAASPG
jgi:DNA-binding LacI/PurR family transcriptional regulator